MANKKINELDSRSSLSLSDLMAVGDPSTGYLYKTTISDLKTLTGAGVVSFNGRFGSVVPVEGDYTLTQLGDVIITSASSGQVLQYNGSNWVNATIDLSGYVTLSGTQTITGSKTFSSFTEFNNPIYANAEIILAAVGAAYQTLLRNINAVGVVTSGFNSIGFNSNNNLYFTAHSKGYCEFAFSNPGTGRTYTLPGTSGTFALTSQIHDQLTIGTANGLSLSTQVLSLALASTSTNGALSSTDWNTFNNKASTSSLSSYLPLAGGTLTDQLSVLRGSGTGLDVASDLVVFRAATGFSTPRQITLAAGNGATTYLEAKGYGGNYITDFGIRTYNASGTAFEVFFATSAGNVGIGTTSPSSTLDVSGTGKFSSSVTATSLIVNGGTTSSYITAIESNSTFAFGSTNGKRVAYISSNTGDKPGLQFGYDSADNTGIIAGATNVIGAGLDFYTYNGSAWGNKMRITSGGQVLINRSSAASSEEIFGIKGKVDSTAMDLQVGTDTYYGIRFRNQSGGQAGYIQVNTSVVIYGTGSDYRLKNDLRDYNGLELISKIKTYDFAWNVDNSRNYGVIAHELEEVIPYAVGGKKDAVDKNGIINPQGVDYSKLVPILVKAVQELKVQIEELKAKIK